MKEIKIKKEDFKNFKFKIKVKPQIPIKECECLECELEKYEQPTKTI